MRRRLFYKEDETTTPLPWTMLLVLTTLCILNDVNVTMLFSFAPKLIKTTFGYSEIEAGYYTGILSSVFYIGILLCSFFWSYLGDTRNKKCSIIISSIGHTLATLAFGFSNQYYFACVARFLQGCFFGVIYMSKSMLYNHLDDSNMTHCKWRDWLYFGSKFCWVSCVSIPAISVFICTCTIVQNVSDSLTVYRVSFRFYRLYRVIVCLLAKQ